MQNVGINKELFLPVFGLEFSLNRRKSQFPLLGPWVLEQPAGGVTGATIY
jgi:hypothetical protein